MRHLVRRANQIAAAGFPYWMTSGFTYVEGCAGFRIGCGRDVATIHISLMICLAIPTINLMFWVGR